jgi:integrase
MRGCGYSNGLELRVKDIDFDRGELTIRDGKGSKDRVTMVPAPPRERLRDHLTMVKAQHQADLRMVAAASRCRVRWQAVSERRR